MFRGVSNLNLDVKGRLAIPVKYREVLTEHSDGQLVVTVNYGERCLLMYPLSEWAEIEKKLVGLPSLDPVAQRLKRLLIGHATDCELDGSGRALLPAPLREFAHLDKRIVLIGQGNKFEIWDENLWNTRRDDWLEQRDGESPLPVEVETLSL
ncbi:MAG: division/cell wall cluster transcriptional repressor MraZ [Gammaproteobacteria bacterium]|nr:division/cell wall cluster transcriptional repressor MraZ [Gammaproteobacteria bacterium]